MSDQNYDDHCGDDAENDGDVYIYDEYDFTKI